MRPGSWLHRSTAIAALCWLHAAGQTVSAAPGDERILDAREAASRGNLPRLSQLAAQRSNHVLDPYVTYWQLSVQVARTTDPLPVDSVQRFLADNEGSALAERLRSDWLKRVAREGQWSLFDEHYSRLAQPDQELQCHAMQRPGGNPRAIEAQWLSLTDTPDACDAPLRALVVAGHVSEENVWARFRRLVEAKRLSGAREAAGWTGNDAAQTMDLLGSVLDNPGRFLGTPRARQTATRAQRELVLAAVTRQARSDVRDAARRWQEIEDRFPAPERAYAWGQLAWLAAQGQMAEANSWYDRAGNIAMAEEQHAWRVRAALRSLDWARVRRAVEHMPQAQREQAAWSYWLARAHIETGHSREATALLNRQAGEPHFYGILSAEALGRRFDWPEPALPASVGEMEKVQAMPELQRALALYRLDLRTEGMREWNWGLRNADDRVLLAAAEYGRREGLYDRAINTADRTKAQHDYSLRYLAPYYDVFSAEAKSRGLDLAWVYGLVRQESRFQPVVRSSAGAQGLMQVMPATGKWIANKAGFDGYHAGWLTDVNGNVRLGTAYLRTVLDDLGGSPVLASAAYNAGPGRARRWRDPQRTLEGAIYAETIPFTETRDYVKKVMANAIIYARLFDSDRGTLTQRLATIGPSGS